MRCGKTTAATRKATAAATMGSRGKAAASSTTATAKMVLRARAGRNAGGSKKDDKDERDRTHGFDLHVAPSLNA